MFSHDAAQLISLDYVNRKGYKKSSKDSNKSLSEHNIDPDQTACTLHRLLSERFVALVYQQMTVRHTCSCFCLYIGRWH